MPFTVKQLLGDRSEPVSVSKDETVEQALDRMMAHDFSQLPVIDTAKAPCGLITSDSILRAVKYTKATPDKLSVLHAMIQRPAVYRLDDNLFDILDDVRDKAAVLIVDGSGCLTGIITSYDTTDYFHRRAEDLMWIEDIELAIRDYVKEPYRDDTGEVDTNQFNAAIEAITPSGKDLSNRFRNAVKEYLSQCGQSDLKLDNNLLDQMAQKYLPKPSQPKSVDRLDLNDYVQLLGKVWSERYESLFQLDWQVIKQLLDFVRETRNAVAHFREISSQQRDHLRYCAGLLSQYSTGAVEVLSSQSTEIVTPHIGIGGIGIGGVGIICETRFGVTNLQVNSEFDEEVGSDESRYVRLGLYLQNLPIEQNKVQLSFSEIESIIHTPLPPSAQQHRIWWANDSVGQPQSQQWLDAGWRVSGVNINEQRISFSRIGDRQGRYIKFFNILNDQLKKESSLIFEPKPVTGRHWQVVGVRQHPEHEQLWLAVSFAHRHRLRVEFYIDRGDIEVNKALFDALQQRQLEIESIVGESLSWERLDPCRASRLALYHDGGINDEPETLASLRTWSIDALGRLYQALVEPVAIFDGESDRGSDEREGGNPGVGEAGDGN